MLYADELRWHFALLFESFQHFYAIIILVHTFSFRISKQNAYKHIRSFSSCGFFPSYQSSDIYKVSFLFYCTYLFFRLLLRNYQRILSNGYLLNSNINRNVFFSFLSLQFSLLSPKVSFFLLNCIIFYYCYGHCFCILCIFPSVYGVYREKDFDIAMKRLCSVKKKHQNIFI